MTEENLRGVFEAFVEEELKWSQLEVSMHEIAAENRALVRDLSRFDRTETVSLVGGLLTVPRYQSHCLRFELLVTLAAIHCHGRRRPQVKDACRWFRRIGSSRCARAEDPAEDVLVSLVHDERGDYRILEGGWEGAGFYTQVILDAVSAMPEEGVLARVKRSARSLLGLSDLMCRAAGLERYQDGSGELHSALSQRRLPDRSELISRTRVRLSDLARHGVDPAGLKPFLLSEQMRDELDRQAARYNYLDRHPLIALTDTHLTVAKPSALSVAIRDYAIGQALLDERRASEFDEALAEAYSMRLSRARFLADTPGALSEWSVVGEHRLAGFVRQIDDGYYVAVHCCLPAVRTHGDGGFGRSHVVEEPVARVLRRSSEHVGRRLGDEPSFKGGLVLVVGCGWGRAQVMGDVDGKGAAWRSQYVSAADFVRLWDVEGVNAQFLWSLLEGVGAAERAGVQLVNPNGLLNLIGWVQSNDGRVVPHPDFHYPDTVSPEAPLLLQIPTDLLRSVRAEAVQRLDRHHAVDGRGRRHELMRTLPDGVFETESSRRVYGSVSSLARGELTCVYEGSANLWVIFAAPNISDSTVESALFRMIGVWLHRIGAVFDAKGVIAGEGESSTAYLEFLDHVESLDGRPAEELGGKPSAADLGPLCGVEGLPEEKACKAVFEVGFLDGFRIAENVAERLVVRTLIRAYLRLCGVEDEDAEVRAMESLVVSNDEARDFHIFQPDDYHGYVRGSLPGRLVEHESVDQGTARIGLASRGGPVPGSRSIEGRSACTEFLAEVVDSLVGDLTARLAVFDRRPALTRLALNCEKADAEERRWTMTSAAILGLHGSEAKTMERFVERKSRFAGTRAASRILVEMGLCACSADGGKRLSDIETRQLLARVDLLVQLGGLSDAIHFNVLQPEIVVSPVGDLRFRDDFGALVARPMLFRMIHEGVIADAPLQKRNYDDPRTASQEGAPIEAEFLHIWKEEMGFELRQAGSIVGALEQYGFERGEAVTALARQRYFDLVCAGGVPEQAAASFLTQFALRSRTRWQDPPDGFAGRDIYPWRFGRRLSYITRPILVLDDGDDVELMVAPAALRQALTYVFQGARSGRLDRSFFRTQGMRDSWLGKAREGHSFNAAVAEELLAANWTVSENLGLPELLNRGLERNHGDIDVLAWRDDRKTVLVIECKDLAPARNYSEIAALLSEYQGVERNGRADKLRRHLDRVSLLREHRNQVERFTGVSDPQVLSCLVCSGPVPMQYAGIDALAGTKVGTLDDVRAILT